MPKDYAKEYERLSNEVYLKTSPVSKRGFISTLDGVYFNKSLVEASLKAAHHALEADPNDDLLRLARAMLLRTIGRTRETEVDAKFLVSRGGEFAKAGRLLLKQLE